MTNQNLKTTLNLKQQHTTAVSRNGEARDLFEIGKVFNLKICLYLCRLGLGSSPLLEAATRCVQAYERQYAEGKLI